MNKNIYLLLPIGLYVAAFITLINFFGASIMELTFIASVIGIGFSALAFTFTKKIAVPHTKPAVKTEAWLLLALLGWIIIYITFISSGVKNFLADHSLAVQHTSLIVLVNKLSAFVLIPFVAYRLYGYTMKDLLPGGFSLSSIPIVTFITLSTASVLFQLFFSKGGGSFLTGEFTLHQLVAGIPLCFLWLVIEAGIVEEFFFRVILQSRIAAITGSGTGAILWGALIFGVIHAPGLFLRGASSEAVSGQMPFGYWICFTICYMAVAGVFLGVIWQRTKNFMLVIAIHAMFDLLPNYKEFIEVWNIG